MKWLVLLVALLVLPVAVFGGLVAMLGVAFVVLLAVAVPLLPFIIGVLLVMLVVKLLSGPKHQEPDQIVVSQ
jgi:hypothetical protein